MRIDEARRLAEVKIEALAQELERGQSDTLKAYLAAMAKLPRYSVHNLLLIMAQRPGAQQQCAGLKAWNRLGRYVRKGEHGIMILAPVVRRRQLRPTAPTEPEKTDDSGSRDREGIVTSFRRVFVFAEDQTEGAPLPQPACVDGEPGVYYERLVQLMADRGITLTYASALGKAHGLSTRNRIILRDDLHPGERFSTAVHELSHILLAHHVRDDARATATVHETEAEAVAYVVCQAIGLETNTAAADYLLTWGGDPALLAARLERIQRTAAEIITAIGPDV